MLKKALILALVLLTVLALTADVLHCAGSKQGKAAGVSAPAAAPAPPVPQAAGEEASGNTATPAEKAEDAASGETSSADAGAVGQTPEAEAAGKTKPQELKHEFFIAAAQTDAAATATAKKLAETCGEATDGALALTFRNDLADLSDERLTAFLLAGELDIIVVTAESLAEVLPEAACLTTGAVLAGRDEETLYGVLNGENSFTARLNAAAEEKGFTVAAFLLGRPLVTAVDRIPETPGAWQGLRVITETTGTNAFYAALGAEAETLSGEKLGAALDYPVANAWETTVAGLAARTRPENMAYTVLTGTTAPMYAVLLRTGAASLIDAGTLGSLTALLKSTAVRTDDAALPEDTFRYDDAYFDEMRALEKNRQAAEAFEKRCPGILSLLETELARASRTTVNGIAGNASDPS